MARFGQAPKTLKTSAAAFEGLRTSQPSAAAQQLSKASHLLGHGTSLGPTSCFYWASKLPCGPTSCFYWASKLLCGTFWASPKSFKTSAAAFEGLRTSQPSAAAQQLSKASRLLGHGTSLGPTSCFYWASKLPCGTFCARPKTLKTSAAAFEGLRTSQPSAAAQQLSKASRLLGHGTSLGPTSCFLLGFETARFGQAPKPSKPPQQLSKALEPHNPPQQLSSFRRRPACWPWYLPRPHKLFLLGFETAMWHVLGRRQNPQTLRSSFRRPYLEPRNPPQQLSSFRRCPTCLAMVPP